MDFFAVKVVTGSGVKAGMGQSIDYTSIWRDFRNKNSLCNRKNTRNNENV